MLIGGGGLLAAGLGGPLPQARAAATPKRGGTLNVVLSLTPTSLLTLATTAGSDYSISAKMTEGLLAYGDGIVPKPQLATSWATSDDGLQIRFSLREGVKWHDGQPFTSKDVAFSILLLKEVHPRGRLTFANVVDVRTPDGSTAVIVLASPAPYLLSALAAEESPIVPRHIYEGGNAATNPHNNAPIGTGPYRFKEWVRGSHIILKRNPDYWDQPKPYLDRIVFKTISDEAACAAVLETGEAHIGGATPVALSDIERLRSLPHLAIETKGYDYLQNMTRLEFDLEHEAFRHLKVRQAIAHAIDKRTILNTAFYGYGQISTGPIPKAHAAFYTPDVPAYPFDPKRSERLLDEAGFPRGSDGIRFRITHDPLPTLVLKRSADYLRQALGKIGIGVTIRSQDFPTYIKRVYTDRSFDLIFNNMNTSSDPTLGVQRLYWSKNIKKGVPFSNAAHYRNPEVDRLLEAAAREIDPSIRAGYFKQFQKVVVGDLPAIDILVPLQVTIYDKRVKDHTLGPDGINANWADLWLDA